MVVPYKIREQDGKWQVLVEEPPRGMTASRWITCQTKKHAVAIAGAPVLEQKVEEGERGEELAQALDLASEGWKFATVGNKMLSNDVMALMSRRYSTLAEKARGEENE